MPVLAVEVVSGLLGPFCVLLLSAIDYKGQWCFHKASNIKLDQEDDLIFTYSRVLQVSNPVYDLGQG